MAFQAIHLALMHNQNYKRNGTASYLHAHTISHLRICHLKFLTNKQEQGKFLHQQI